MEAPRLRLLVDDQADDSPPQPFCRLPDSATRSPDLSDLAYRILGALMTGLYKGHRSARTNAEIGQIAGGKSIRTVQRGLKELEAAGLIAITIEAGDRRIDLLYQLKTPAAHDRPVTPP